MKNRIGKVLLVMLALYALTCIIMLYLLEFRKASLILAIATVIVGIIFVCANDIKARYFFMKRKKAIIYADINNSKLIRLYYGQHIANSIFDLALDKIDNLVTNGCVKTKYRSNYIILTGYNSKSDIVNLINKINNEIQNIKCDELFNLSIKFGVQMCDEEGYDQNENKAELACNLAKSNISNTYQFYNASEFESQLKEKMILNELIYALKHKQFEVYYQPKFDYKINDIVGSEALVRLKKDSELVPAKNFIDVAEKHGFTVFLDKYVLKEVCKKIQELKKKKIEFGIISVNVSRNTLCEEDMMDYYSKMLDDYGVKKCDIELEITERDSNNNDDLNVRVHKLSRKFNVSIDDFGIGKSSLSMLSENNIRTIKIDRKFIVDESENGKKILNNIIKLAKELEFEVVAEGVETKEQYDYLKSKGCNIIQGYYYSKPLCYEDYEKLLLEKRS